MEVLFQRVAGLDVHKKLVVACVRRLTSGGKIEREVRHFGTMTRDLLALSDWLQRWEVTHVAMESTGVFWKPVYNLLEGNFDVLVVNAHHIKQVPGRKTDVRDCEWIAQLLQCGLLRPSFVPERTLRDLRDLTRHRAKLTQQTTAVGNRIEKVLEDANIKLGSVASEVLGVSGRAMIEAIIAGETDAEKLADLARRKLRGKIPELRIALEGKVTEHHRFMLQTLLEQWNFLKTAIDRVSQRIEEVSPPFFRESVELLCTMPGIEERAAQNVLAETGTDMGQFPSARHLSSWGGICPGNNESAGKRKSSATPKANRWLRRSLGEAAWAASHSRDTYLRSRYQRLAAHRGRKRAIVALSHTMLVAIYHMLSERVPYDDLGPNHFERIGGERRARYHVKKLEALGHRVELRPVEAAA
jgi:transposase